MAIEFVSAGTPAFGAVTLSVPLPSGYTTGDFLLLYCVAGTTPTPGTPSGWTLISAQGANRWLTSWYRIAPSPSVAQPSLSVGNTSSKAVIVAYRGVDSLGPIADSYGAALSGTSLATPTLTTTSANNFVVGLYGWSTSTNTATADGATTARVNSDSGTGLGGGLLIADELQASAGTSAVRTATLANSAAWSTFSISLVPSPDAPGGVTLESGVTVTGGVTFA